MKKLLLAVILLCVAHFSNAQINGVVFSDDGFPLANATVRLLESKQNKLTDEQGRFAFENPQLKECTLEVRFLGYKTETRKIDLTYLDEVPGTSVDIDRLIRFKLKPKYFSSGTVEVTATRAGENTPMTKSNVSKAEIEKRNFGQDLPYLINTTTSLVANSDAGAGIGYTNLRIRGSDQARINVTINGIALNDPESRGVFWVNMPDFGSSLDNIQIQRGVGTSTNGGGAFGASINLQTDDQSLRPFTSVDNSFGSFNSRKHALNFGTGKLGKGFQFNGRLSLIKSDGFVDRAESDLRSYYLSGGYYGDKSSVKLIHFSGKERTYQSWWGTPESRILGNEEDMRAHAANNGLSDAQLENLLNSDRSYNYYEYENEVDNYKQDHYQLHFATALNKNLLVNSALHYTKGAGFFEQFKDNEDFLDYGFIEPVIGGDTIGSTDLIRRRWLDNDYYGMTADLNYNGKKLNQIFGGAYSNYVGDHFGEVIWASISQGVPLGSEYYNNQGVKSDWNLFSKSSYGISDKLNAFLDLQIRGNAYRVDGIDSDRRNINVDTSYLFFNPKAGFFFKGQEKSTFEGRKLFTAYASIAVAHGEPVRNDFIDAPIGKTPKVERLIDYEAGLTQEFSGFRLGLNFYFMNYRDQLVVTGELNDVGTAVRTNVDKSYRRGLELELNKSTKKLRWSGNLALSQNKIEKFNELIYDYTNGFDIINIEHENTDIAFSPGIIVGNNITYQWRELLSIGLISKYVGEQYLDNTSNDQRKIEDYHRHDLVFAIDQKIGQDNMASLSFVVNNVFNSLYQSNGYTYSYKYGDLITENFYYPQAGRNWMLRLKLSFN